MPLGIISIIISLILYLSLRKYRVYEKKSAIKYYGYKIFKFIINQLSSGITVREAIISMYLVVDNRRLKTALIDVGAYYSKTNDIQSALDILKNDYDSLEVDTLSMAIKEAVNTGSNYDTLHRVEEMLFKKYINQISLETSYRKKKSIFAVFIFSLVIILMVSIPVIFDLNNALSSIFK